MAELGSSGGSKTVTVMKKTILSFLLLALPLMVSSQNVTYYTTEKIEGVYYQLFEYNSSERIAKVTSNQNGKYSGNIVIPSSVKCKTPVYHNDAPPTYVEKTYIVTAIASGAFYECSEVTSITLPNTITTLEAAFRGCSSLASIEIPDGVTEIKDCTFQDCSSLTSVTLPNQLTSIGWQAFMNCSSLSSISLPNTLTKMANAVFSGCSSLTSIVIPDGIKVIGAGVFADCSSLTSVTLPAQLESIGGAAFYKCSELTSITIPDNVTSIGNSAFERCSGLSSVTLGSGVTSIGQSAFSNCEGLTSLTIPDNVTSIEEYAFSRCSGLQTVYSYIKDPYPIASNTFYTSNVNLYVPKGTKSKYKETEGWKNFTNIIEMDAENPVSLTGLILNKTKMILSVGSTAMLKAYAFPGNVEIKNVKWSTSDNSVATIADDGTVMGVKEGTATITCTLADKPAIFSNCTVIIKEGYIGGDLNDDGEIDVTDVVELIDMVLLGSNDPAGDINGDGEVDVTDVVELIDIVLGN